jgi:alpha-D-ribose 1-methylphosphonate 5-triphosphate synthase subunit PhnG
MSEHQSLIMAMDRESLAGFSELLSDENIQVIRTPQTGMLMMVAKDPFDTDFCLGEILITEAETEYQGRRGYAMVMGDEPEKAILAAAVAAILQGGDDALKTRIGQFLAPLASGLTQKAERERQLLTKTLVNFETMVKG